MAKVPVYNAEGAKAGTMDVPDEIFGVKIDPRLVQQAVVTQLANRRKPKSEVRGGGRKPWRQKGTGRARHGSIRSPLWRGGGVTFGPRSNRNFSLKMNQKARRRALFMTLTDKAENKQLVILDGLSIEKPKTKTLVSLFKKLPLHSSILFVLPEKRESIQKSARNISHVSVIRADSLNVVDVLRHRGMVVLKKSVEVIGSTYRAASSVAK